MSLRSSHSILTPASPQPCLTHLSTLLSAEEDSASICSLEPERVFKHEGLFREADKHKTMKRKPLASLSLKVSSTQTSSALNNKLICPGVPPAPEHGVGALRECLKVLVGRTEGSTSHPLSILGSLFQEMETAVSKEEGVGGWRERTRGSFTTALLLWVPSTPYLQVCAVTRLNLRKHIQEYFVISKCWAVTRCYGCKPLQNRNHVLQAFCSPHCIEHGAECVSVCHSVMSNSVRPRGL